MFGLKILVEDGFLPAMRVSGEVDLSNYQELVVEVMARAPREGEWILDLRHVTYMDSSGARALLALRDHFGNRFILRSTEPIVRVLEVLGLSPHFRLYRGTYA